MNTACMANRFDNFFKWIIYSSVAFYIFSCALPFFSNIPIFILACAGIISIVFGIKNKPRKFSSISIFFIFFILSFLFSTFFSQNLERTISLSFPFLPGLLLFFILFEFFEDKKEYYMIYGWFSITSAVVSLIALHTALVSDQPTPSNWAHQTGLPYFIVPNDFMMLTVFMPFLVVMAIRNASYTFKTLSILVLGLNLLLFIVYQSRGAILLSLTAIGLPLFMIKKIPFKKIYVYLPVCVIILICIDSLFGLALSKKVFTKSSWFSRLTPWLIAVEMFKSAPIFGTGPRTFGYFYPILVNQFTFPDWIIIDNRVMPWAHNVYLETMAEQGIVGLIILFALIGIAMINFKRLFSCCNSRDPVIIVFSSTVILILGGIIEFSFIRHFFVIVFFAIIGLISALSNKVNSDGDDYANATV